MGGGGNCGHLLDLDLLVLRCGVELRETLKVGIDVANPAVD